MRRRFLFFLGNNQLYTYNNKKYEKRTDDGIARGVRARGRGAIQRMAGPGGQRRESCPDARPFLRLRERRHGGTGREGAVREFHDAERYLEIFLGKGRRRASNRFLAGRLQRQGMGRHARARRMGIEWVWRPAVREHRLPLAGAIQKQPAGGAHGGEPRGFVPPRDNRAGLVERQADYGAFRLGDVEHVPLGKRPLRGL